MSKEVYYYTTNPIIQSDLNITFEDVLEMDREEFDEWSLDIREELLNIWNEHGVPPVVGKSKKSLVDKFEKFLSYNYYDILKYPDDGEEKNVLWDFTSYGSVANAFFPSMMKVRISSKFNKDEGNSIYEVFSDPDLEDFFLRRCYLKLKLDRMYIFSKCVEEKERESGTEWVERFVDSSKYNTHNIWIEEKINYAEREDYLLLDSSDVQYLYKNDIIGDEHIQNLTEEINELSDEEDGKTKDYFIRVYERNQKVFPSFFQAFRIGFNSQPAGNFSPVVSRFLYTEYTKNLDQDKCVIYDSSAGWGGRLLGALAVDTNDIHYIGTDPNTNNYIEEIDTTRYEYMANFFIENTSLNNSFWGDPNEFDIFMEGSEEIYKNPEFQRYKGKVDFAFTSPPYFNKERYSDDDSQSWKKFPEYERWKSGFLKPTIETIVKWLKPNRYVAWNIANIQFDDRGYLPLEEDSREFFEDMGMEYVKTYKMLMTKMIGLDVSKIDNKVKVDGDWVKYEPIFVFKKPK